MYKFYAGRAERADLLDGGKGARACACLHFGVHVALWPLGGTARS